MLTRIFPSIPLPPQVRDSSAKYVQIVFARLVTGPELLQEEVLVVQSVDTLNHYQHLASIALAPSVLDMATNPMHADDHLRWSWPTTLDLDSQPNLIEVMVIVTTRTDLSHPVISVHQHQQPFLLPRAVPDGHLVSGPLQRRIPVRTVCIL